ncbi:MAG: hypothetical protein PHN50_09045, partial [Bacteroidales bacterium]|nr:hypothetical protein [Bacteroidales bacterium]
LVKVFEISIILKNIFLSDDARDKHEKIFHTTEHGFTVTNCQTEFIENHKIRTVLTLVWQNFPLE